MLFLSPITIPQRLSLQESDQSVERLLQPSAWCHELEHSLTAAEAWELLYGFDRVDFPLTFQCLDTRCSARLILRNCYAHTLASEAHFRLFPRERHHPACSSLKAKRQQKNVQARKASRREAALRSGGWHVYSN